MEETISSKIASAFFTDEQAGRLILHNMQESFVLLNPQLSVVYLNRAAREGIRAFLGLDVFPGMSILELAKDERKAAVENIYAQVLQGHRYVTESEFNQDDGGIVYFENTFHPAYDNDGSIVGIIVSSKNITERKKAQQAIVASEERLQTALDAAAQGAWDWNLLTNEVVYSASYKKLYGFDDNDLKNDVSEWITRIHPDDQAKMRDLVTDHLLSGKVEYNSQYRIMAKDGVYRWVMAKGRLVSFDANGKPTRMIGTHTDITERMEREQALKLMNERFDCMIKATHELLWEWDIATNTVFRAKEAIRNVYGIGDDSPIRQPEAWIHHLHPDDRPKIATMLQDMLKGTNQQTFEMEYRFRRSDGSFAHIYDRCILLKDENDRPVRLIGAAQDISERKRLEKELLQNELDYQRLIHQAMVDSQEKERSEIGRELHDNINQVLTTTKLYLDLASTNTELRDELLRKSQMNINNVIQEIRLLSRSLMDEGIDDLGLLNSINDLVENIHLTQQVKINLTANNAIEDALDSNQKLTVFRIIQESLNNVLRHASAETVDIIININQVELTMLIQDDGVGFHPDNTKKGVGLKNIQNRVYLVNGTLQLLSKPGNGCTIKIQFPIHKFN